MARKAAGSSESGRIMLALDAAFNAGGVHVVTVPVDYSENMRVLVKELHAHAPKGGG